MIYNTYSQFRKAIEEKIKDKVPSKVWSMFTDLSCMNLHTPFDGEDLEDAVFAIKKLMEHMPQR